MVAYAQTAWFLPVLAALAIVSLGAAYWVYRDASRRGSERAVGWGVATLVFGLVPLAVYLLARRKLEGPHPPPTRSDRLVRNAVVAALLTFVLTALGPPDPFTQSSTAVVALPVLLGLAVLLTYRDVLTGAS